MHVDELHRAADSPNSTTGGIPSLGDVGLIVSVGFIGIAITTITLLIICYFKAKYFFEARKNV